MIIVLLHAGRRALSADLKNRPTRADLRGTNELSIWRLLLRSAWWPKYRGAVFVRRTRIFIVKPWKFFPPEYLQGTAQSLWLAGLVQAHA